MVLMQAVGPVAVTSLLLGSNVKDIIDAPIQDNPNTPHNQYAQDQYNQTCTQVYLTPERQYVICNPGQAYQLPPLQPGSTDVGTEINWCWHRDADHLALCVCNLESAALCMHNTTL